MLNWKSSAKAAYLLHKIEGAGLSLPEKQACRKTVPSNNNAPQKHTQANHALQHQSKRKRSLFSTRDSCPGQQPASRCSTQATLQLDNATEHEDAWISDGLMCTLSSAQRCIFLGRTQLDNSSFFTVVPIVLKAEGPVHRTWSCCKSC